MPANLLFGVHSCLKISMVHYPIVVPPANWIGPMGCSSADLRHACAHGFEVKPADFQARWEKCTIASHVSN